MPISISLATTEDLEALAADTQQKLNMVASTLEQIAASQSALIEQMAALELSLTALETALAAHEHEPETGGSAPPPETVPPPDALPETDVVVDVGAFVANSRFESGVSHVDHSLIYSSNANAKTRAKNVIGAIAGWHGVHIQNFGVGEMAKWDGVGAFPTVPNMGSFDTQANLAKQMGGRLIVALYNIPWWCKGKTTYANGVQTTVQYTSAEAFATDGRLLTDMKPHFHALMVNVFRHIMRVHKGRDFVVWNEYKGHQGRARDDRGQMYDFDEFAGTPGHADLGYCEVYRLFAAALTEACETALNDNGEPEPIPLSDVRLFGPYAILRSQGVNDADSVGAGHALHGRAWGSMNKTGTQALEYFLDWCKRTGTKFDGLSLDFGTGNKDGKTGTLDDFAVAEQKTADILNYANALLVKNGFAHYPIVASELYIKPQMPTPPGNTAYRAAQKAVALIAWVRAGGWLPLWWGINGLAEGPNEGIDPAPGEGGLVTSTGKSDGGQPLPFAGVLGLFHEHFPAGAPIHAVTLSGAASGAVAVLAGSEHALLVNKTAEPKTVTIRDQVVTLSAYEYKYV